MGTYEILERSSEESFRDIVEVKTPSPLGSSESSESNKSLLTGINELLERRLASNSRDKFAARSLDQDISEYLDFREKLDKKRENSSSSIERSSSSSPSSLKQRIRNFPTSNENHKFVDRLAALDRRIRREKDAYLQLLDSNDRIDEKDEGETSPPDENVMIAAESRNEAAARGSSRRTGKASFSAPGSTRLEMTVENVVTARSKKFDEPRPPKYLRPIEPAGREIIRSNAPPLCLTDEKIMKLIRRGSASAREESLRKSRSFRAPRKLAVYGKPTGLIIENLSSDSENEENEKSCGSAVTGLDRETRRDETNVVEITNGAVNTSPDENIRGSNRLQTSPKETSNCSNLRRNGARSNEDNDFSDDPGSSRSGKIIEKATRTRNNVERLKGVVENADEKNGENSRSILVPRLEIKSREYSRSTSVASREDTTKRSFDVDQLIRALSDVSIQQQIDRQIAWADRHFPVSSNSHLEKNVDRLPASDDVPSKFRRKRDSEASHEEETINENIVEVNRVDKMPRKIGKMSYSKSSDYIKSPDKTPRALKAHTSRIKSSDTKNNFRSFESLVKRGPEKPLRRALRGQVSEPVTSRNCHGEEIGAGCSSRRHLPASNAKRNESCSVARRDSCRVVFTGKRSKASSDRSIENNRFDNDEKNGQNDSKTANKRDSDRAHGATFDVYEDPCEDLTKENENLSSETSQVSPGLTETKDRSPNQGYERRSNSNWKSPASRNLFWADNTSELSRGMASGSSDSRSRDFHKDLDNSGSRSCLISPGVSMQTLSKLSSSGAATDASRFGSEDSTGVSKNPETVKRLGNAGGMNKENEISIEDENTFFPSRSIIKKLSYEEIQERVKTIDSSRKMSEKKQERSESAVYALRKELDGSSPYRGKLSSSLSRLEASPNDSRRNSSNLGLRKKSQERSPFTITCVETSPPVLKAGRNAHSETAYRIGFNQSRVRLVNGGIEQSTVEASDAFSIRPNIRSYEKRRPFVPKIRKFVGKLSRWREWKSCEERRFNVDETTRVLYENKACRAGEASSASTSESTAAALPTNRPCSSRDGLWVEGFGDETRSNKESVKTLNPLEEVIEKYEFIATRNIRDEEEADIDLDQGCFCSKFCRFLIRGNDYHRYTFPSKRTEFNQ